MEHHFPHIIPQDEIPDNPLAKAARRAALKRHLANALAGIFMGIGIGLVALVGVLMGG